jgi:hypothetical protein
MAFGSDPGGSGGARVFDKTNGLIDEKGRFELRGVMGPSFFGVTPVDFTGGPTGWFLKSVRLNGEDITYIPFEPSEAGNVTTLEIVMTDTQSTLAGTVRNSRGEPVTDYTVAIFPVWLKDAAIAARYTRTVRPDQQGRYETRGLPAGDYFAVAVESLEQGGHWDPAFRKQVEPTAKRFRLTEGQTATVDLQLMQ